MSATSYPSGRATGPYSNRLVTSSTSAPAAARAAQRARSYGGVNAGGSTTWTRIRNDSSVDLSYCVVNTNGRDLLLACLASIRNHGLEGGESEILVVDNASDDGSADAVEAWNASPKGLGDRLRLIRGERREGKAKLDSLLLSEAAGELCLLL